MFDDIKNSVLKAGSENSLKSVGPVAPKPPLGQVEDIFSESEKAAAKASASQGIAGSGLERPAVFQPKNSPPAEDKEAGADSKDNLKKILILGSGALGVLIILGGAWYGYAKFFKGSGSNIPSQITTKEESEAPEKTLKEEEQKENAPVAPLEEVNEPAVAQPVDTDQDGLTDDEEKQLGINQNKVDTDDDGLFDREEVKVYKTDPLNPDTDGDKFSDGDEVKNGYNPKGAGKLFEIKQKILTYIELTLFCLGRVSRHEDSAAMAKCIHFSRVPFGRLCRDQQNPTHPSPS